MNLENVDNMSDAEIEELLAAISQRQQKKRNEVLATVTNLIEQYGLTVNDCFPNNVKAKQANTRSRGDAVPAKYRYGNELELTWTGRGLAPKALTNWLDSKNLTLDQFKNSAEFLV